MSPEGQRGHPLGENDASLHRKSGLLFALLVQEGEYQLALGHRQTPSWDDRCLRQTGYTDEFSAIRSGSEDVCQRRQHHRVDRRSDVTDPWWYPRTDAAQRAETDRYSSLYSVQDQVRSPHGWVVCDLGWDELSRFSSMRSVYSDKLIGTTHCRWNC